MARFALLGCLVLVLAGAVGAEDKKEVPKDLVPFQGTWKVLAISRDGTPAPKDESLAFTFDGTKLTIAAKDKSEGGTFAVDPKKEPAAIDVSTPKGDKAAGIYKFDADGKLTLCFVGEKGAARPKSFDAKDTVLLVLEKAKK